MLQARDIHLSEFCSGDPAVLEDLRPLLSQQGYDMDELCSYLSQDNVRMIFIKDGKSNDKVVAVAAVNRLDSIDLLSAFRDQDIAAYIRSMAAGAIAFDREEVKFTLDADNEPTGVFFKISKDANKLIEEFMLLANRKVATFVGSELRHDPVYQGVAPTFVYRVHDDPNPEKLASLAGMARKFGYKVLTKDRQSISRSLNRMLTDVRGHREENMLTTLAMRSMAKAEYSTDNIGHYGLAFEYYTHFTSPIRRYPDMLVHRLLTKYLDLGGRSVSEQKYEALCEHSSSMEQIAANAERASIKYKQVEYMTERLGQTYDGVISGVTEWGLYVELNENKCEGMIPIRDLDDDYYEFDEKNYCLRGRRKKRTYSLGDAITIKVARANLEKKQLDFALIE